MSVISEEHEARRVFENPLVWRSVEAFRTQIAQTMLPGSGVFNEKLVSSLYVCPSVSQSVCKV